jgi:hypothetical protein
MIKQKFLSVRDTRMHKRINKTGENMHGNNKTEIPQNMISK